MGTNSQGVSWKDSRFVHHYHQQQESHCFTPVTPTRKSTDRLFHIGLVSLEANTPLPICLPRSKGFDMGLVAVLEKKENVAEYAVHPAHMEYVFG
jgi:hypothetical protein